MGTRGVQSTWNYSRKATEALRDCYNLLTGFLDGITNSQRIFHSYPSLVIADSDCPSLKQLRTGRWRGKVHDSRGMESGGSNLLSNFVYEGRQSEEFWPKYQTQRTVRPVEPAHGILGVLPSCQTNNKFILHENTAPLKKISLFSLNSGYATVGLMQLSFSSFFSSAECPQAKPRLS